MPRRPRDWDDFKQGLTPRVVRRFWSRVDSSAGPDACWPWTHSKNKGGYGVVNVYGSGGPITAQRIAYGLTHGGIPAGLYVCHRCDNPECCNPAHLWAGTHLDNMRDKVEKGRQRSPLEYKTHCKRGHLLAGENLSLSARGRRVCATCTAHAARLWADRRATRIRREAEATARDLRARLARYVPERPFDLVATVGLRKASLIRSYLGIHGAAAMRLVDMAETLGVSRQRVDQLIDAALDQLGAPAEIRNRRRAA